ncbi:MAG: hypothetical protein JJ992_23215 [Planctomycetes bacterium]|nr:hypothetical protein [Planctomycetota bacterium]
MVESRCEPAWIGSWRAASREDRVGDDPAHAKTSQQLETQLMNQSTASSDPRATGRGDEFDRANARPAAAAKVRAKKK